MQELLQAALAPYNIVFTTLLGFVILYWLLIIIGAFDMGSIDADIEMDIDADIDLDTDIGAIGGVAGVLQFFNFGKVPFMVIMSILILSAWAISILTNHYWGGGSTIFALGMLFPNLFVSLLITKTISTPMVPFFKHLREGEAPIDYVGMTGTLRFSLKNDKMSQAELPNEGNPLIVNVKMLDNETLEKNTNIIIVNKDEKEDFFWIKALD